MTKKKKLVVGVSILFLIGLLFFEGRRLTFSVECLALETELEKNFADNKNDFFEIATYVKNTSPIAFDFHSKDTIYMTFRDSSINHIDLFIDSIYYIGGETKQNFRVEERGCLEVIESDTMKVCNKNWKVDFFGHYKNQKISGLLNYYGWTQQDFERLVEKVQKLNCYGFSKNKTDFSLNYKGVSYYNDGITHCFGHSDGYFDYLYTTKPDSFYWQSSLKKLEGNYYGINHWNF